MNCSALTRRISAYLLITATLFASLPVIAAATSATISLSGNEGAIPLHASATFTNHKFCNTNSPPKCWYNNSGSLNVSNHHPNGSTYYMGGQSGQGSANWTTTLDSGAMAQGKHTFTATACDSKGICNSDSQNFTIDNTPAVTASAGRTEGGLDIKGTVDFKEHAGGTEGRIELWYIHPNGYRYFARSTYYEGAEPLSWTWQDIVGAIPDAGKWAQGTYTVQVLAIANNGASKQVDIPITIDNTPAVTASASRTEGGLDIKGTVDFKDHASGAEGRIELWYVHPNGYRYFARSTYYEGAEPLSWTWQDIVGAIADAGNWAQGTYTVQVLAIANNGASKQVDIPITIDNTPAVTASAGRTEGDLDIKGTVDFKEHAGGTEGRIELWYVHPNGYRYFARSTYYEGAEPLSWTWQDIVGAIADAGKWAQGRYTVQVLAIANNGASKQVDIPITIDNTPTLTASAGRTEGDLQIGGTVDFKEHAGGTEGRIELWYIHPNGYRYFARSKYYEGAEPLSWTWQEIVGAIADAGNWAQGRYTVQVHAIANNGVSKQVDIPITIDNTPTLTVSAGRTEGDLDIKGTVDFKEHAGGAEGRIELWYIHPNSYRYFARSKYYEGAEPLSWTWQDIVGAIADAGNWAQGAYTVQVLAIANNGASKQVDIPIIIDNTPQVRIIGPRNFPDLTFDILGSVSFKDFAGGPEGTVTLSLRDVSQLNFTVYGSKSYEGTTIKWKYSDFTGARLSKGTWGTKELMVQAVAKAANGATATSQHSLMIPALGCPMPLR